MGIQPCAVGSVRRVGMPQVGGCGMRRAAHRSLVRVCVCVRVCMHTPPESPAARGPIPTPCPAAGPAAIRVACCCSEARRPAPLLPLRCSAPPCDPCTPTSTSIPGNDLRDVGRSRRRGKRVHAKLPVSGASSERSSRDGRDIQALPACLTSASNFLRRDNVHLLGLLPARRTSSARRRRGS